MQQEWHCHAHSWGNKTASQLQATRALICVSMYERSYYSTSSSACDVLSVPDFGHAHRVCCNQQCAGTGSYQFARVGGYIFGHTEKLAVCNVEEESSGTYHTGTVILNIQLSELNCTTAFTMWSGLSSSTSQSEG